MFEGIDRIYHLLLIGQSNGFDEHINDPGMDLLLYVTIFLCVLTILFVGYKISIGREHLTKVTTRWILLISFLFISPIVYLSSMGIAIQNSKSVEFCNSCHPMEAYVDALSETDSEHISALHYQYRWIAEHQCYSCHTDYGLFGAAGSKIDGINHFVSYYIIGYDTPIKIRGTYNNERCLFCHAPVESFQDIDEHQENAEEIRSSDMSCFGADCHVSPHPKEAADGDE